MAWNWDKDKPASSTSLRASNPQILTNFSDLETALNREHTFSTGGTEADQAHHKKGSARAYFQDAEPGTRVDGGAFTSNDLGSLWFDTNSSPDNIFFVLTATTPTTWTPVSVEIIATLLASNRVFAGTLGVTGNFAVNTNKFTVDAATGNVVVAGTLSVTGVATLGDTSALATSGAPAADAQIANKKYVDDQDTADHPAYTGGESHTDGSGLITKMGVKTINTSGDTTVTFGTAFPNGIVTAVVCFGTSLGAGADSPAAKTLQAASFVIDNPSSLVTVANWIAIGY